MQRCLFMSTNTKTQSSTLPPSLTDFEVKNIEVLQLRPSRTIGENQGSTLLKPAKHVFDVKNLLLATPTLLALLFLGNASGASFF